MWKNDIIEGVDKDSWTILSAEISVDNTSRTKLSYGGNRGQAIYNI